MPLTVSQVLGSAPEALITAAGGLNAAASHVDEQIASGRFHMTALGNGVDRFVSGPSPKQC